MLSIWKCSAAGSSIRKTVVGLLENVSALIWTAGHRCCWFRLWSRTGNLSPAMIFAKQFCFNQKTCSKFKSFGCFELAKEISWILPAQVQVAAWQHMGFKILKASEQLNDFTPIKFFYQNKDVYRLTSQRIDSLYMTITWNSNNETCCTNEPGNVLRLFHNSFWRVLTTAAEKF